MLPAPATTALSASLKAAEAHGAQVWRDTPPVNGDGTINAYVEITRGDRRKWEFDMSANARVIDRMIPEAVGGYPINYGFVPQTVSYDGDPFDALILGPPLPGGQVTRGIAVGVMFMEDEKGLDSKVVLSTSTRTAARSICCRRPRGAKLRATSADTSATNPRGFHASPDGDPQSKGSRSCD